MGSEVVYQLVILVLAFIYMVALNLRGSKSETTASFLLNAVMVLLASSFYFHGWKFGLGGFFLTVFFMSLTRPLARRLACKMLGQRVGEMNFGHSVSPLDRIRSGETSMFDFMKERNAERENLAIKLESLYHDAEVAAVLSKHGLLLQDYVELYETIGLYGLQDLAWEIISSPDDLERLIAMQKSGRSPVQISSAFRQLN